MDSYSGSGNLSGGGERSHGNTVTSTNSVLSGVRMPGMAPSGMGMLLAGQSTIGKQACRAAASEIDVEVDDRRVGGPMKLPRTDAFPCPDLKMHVATAIDQHQHQHHHYIVRNSGGSSSSSSTGCLMSEGRLAVAPTNSNASDGILFPHDGSGSGSGSGSIVSEGRLLRSDSVLSAAGARPGLPFQVYHYKPAGMPLSLSSMAGMGVGREMGMGMGMGMGMLTAVRPPFSPSQWQELEHQALIFKYMMAGVPVPPDLLLPIRKSLLSFTAGSHQHHPGLTPWSSFQIGYGGNVDPEPGRCRRTDGKKWRCSRDVVPDQKYCERHMHRGRHRGSRKPVEGQTATATATATPVTSQTSTNSTAGASSALSLAAVRTGTNLPPPISINSQCHRQQQQASDQNQSVPKNMSVGMSFGGNENQFHQYQLLVGAGASGTAHKDYRYVNGIKAEDMDEHILFSETPGSTGASHPWRSMAASKATGATPFSQVKMNSNGSLLNYNSTSPQLRSIVGEELGLMSEGSQASNFQTNPGPSQQQYSFMGTVREQEGGQPLRHFFDEWPRVRARDPWSSDVVDLEEEERSKRSSSATQLSISIPMASSDFSATNSTSSPRGKLSLSPLKLSMSRDGNGNKDDDPPSVDPVETGLAVGMNMNLNVEDRHRQHQHQDHHHPQSNWIPSAWENPMGMLGPLAEVLQSSTTTPRGNNNPGLNLMNDIAWNNNNNNKSVGSPSRDSHSQSPPSCIASSPTGVLQKTFGYLTDSINSATTSKTDSSSQIASSS